MLVFRYFVWWFCRENRGGVVRKAEMTGVLSDGKNLGSVTSDSVTQLNFDPLWVPHLSTANQGNNTHLEDLLWYF